MWLEELKKEIDKKKQELAEILALIDKSKSLMSEVERLQTIFASATSTPKVKTPKVKGVKGTRAEKTPEQKAIQSAKMKAYWATKNANK